MSVGKEGKELLLHLLPCETISGASVPPAIRAASFALTRYIVNSSHAFSTAEIEENLRSS